jgi:zinc protease
VGGKGPACYTAGKITAHERTPVTQARSLVLDNGLQVIIAETHASPVASVWVWYRVGSRCEHGSRTGLAHWVEHMLFKGSTRYPKGSVMRLVSQRGGYANAFTSHDYTSYYATVASQHVGLVLDYEADRMTGALFASEEVESERTVILAEQSGGDNEPRQVLDDEVTATAFRYHPYRHQVIGLRDDLTRITRDDLYSFYRRFYVPSNAVLVVAGDVDAEETVRQVTATFGALRGHAVPALEIPEEPEQLGERRLTLRLPGAATLLDMAYRVPAVSHPDFVPLVVAAALLSGGRSIFSFGAGSSRSARLYRSVVEADLASSVDCDLQASLDPHLFSLGATVRQGVSPEAVEQAMLKEIARLQDGLATAEEMSMAIRQTEAACAYASESVTSKALTLGLAAMLGDIHRQETILQELREVTPEDVQRVASTYLVPACRTVGWYLPVNDAGEPDDACCVPGALS